jgi:hypothetical protein
MLRTAAALIVGVLWGSAVSAVAAPIWVEVGDAGNLPGDAQTTAGTGAVTTISGTLPFLDIDMYKIRLTGGGSFSASAEGLPPIFSLDPFLFLFDSAGLGVYANDDAWPPDPFFGPGRALLPSGHALTPLTPGIYYLAIAAYDQFPVSPGGRIFPFSGTGNDVSGPTDPGGAMPVAGWVGNPFYSGAYTITLTGAEFAAADAPEPAMALLAGLGVVCAAWRRRVTGGRLSARKRALGRLAKQARPRG